MFLKYLKNHVLDHLVLHSVCQALDRKYQVAIWRVTWSSCLENLDTLMLTTIKCINPEKKKKSVRCVPTRVVSCALIN